MTVGAIDGLPAGHVGAAGVAASYYSSLGPTGDGRIKPDVVAMGTSVYTTGYTSGYIYGTGTSFAAPGAVGALAIIQGVVEQFHLAYPLLSSTYKALVIHTADSTTVGPNYQTGWGVVDAKAMLDLLTTNYSPQYENSLYELSYKNSLDHIKQIPLPNHGTISGPLPVQAGSTLKVTIAWTDPPAAPQTNAAIYVTTSRLVNDLDLRIIAPNGVTNYPWVLNPDFGNRRASVRSQPATAGDNSVDNVEQVLVTNTIAGTYTFQVTHKGNLANNQPQWVSIIISGNDPLPAPPLWINSTVLTATNQLTLTWSTVTGQLYHIYSTTNLQTTNWSLALTNDVWAAKTNVAMTLPFNPGIPKTFYRIKQENLGGPL